MNPKDGRTWLEHAADYLTAESEKAMCSSKMAERLGDAWLDQVKAWAELSRELDAMATACKEADKS